MRVHLDTSMLVEAFCGARRALPLVRAATARGDILTVDAVVLYEWRRGPRTKDELAAVDALCPADDVAAFGAREAARAANLFQRVKGARQRQADLAIAAVAIEQGAALWTLNARDFEDVPGLSLYRAPR